MAITTSDGTLVSIASTYGVAKTMSAISNANPAVATLEASHNVGVGDFIEITSGWSLLSGKVCRVSAVSVNDVTLEGIDTSDTGKYPAGTGTGSVREITAWAQLSQLTRGVSMTGGDQKFVDASFLEDRVDREIPTTRSPIKGQLQAFFDQSMSWVSTVRAASDAATPKAVRMVYPNGSRTVGNAYWSMSDTPVIVDSTLRVDINLSFSAQPITYAT